MPWTVDGEVKIYNVPAPLTASYFCVFCNDEVSLGASIGFKMAKYKGYDIPICEECAREKYSQAEIESALADSGISIS
jgi:hypothetical protein